MLKRPRDGSMSLNHGCKGRWRPHNAIDVGDTASVNVPNPSLRRPTAIRALCSEPDSPPDFRTARSWDCDVHTEQSAGRQVVP